jgi:hypothetical protein
MRVLMCALACLFEYFVLVNSFGVYGCVYVRDCVRVCVCAWVFACVCMCECMLVSACVCALA